jgi:hypothetical protein
MHLMPEMLASAELGWNVAGPLLLMLVLFAWLSRYGRRSA